jgi:hypothetical protein
MGMMGANASLEPHKKDTLIRGKCELVDANYRNDWFSEEMIDFL